MEKIVLQGVYVAVDSSPPTNKVVFTTGNVTVAELQHLQHVRDIFRSGRDSYLAEMEQYIQDVHLNPSIVKQAFGMVLGKNRPPPVMVDAPFFIDGRGPFFSRRMNPLYDAMTEIFPRSEGRSVIDIGGVASIPETPLLK